MSFLEATWWRPATALAVLALAVLALSVSGAGTAQAGDDGTVTLTPNPREIGVGGQGTIAVELTPPAAGTSIWIIQAKYDPAVAEVAVDGFGNPICTNATAPAGFVFAPGCDTKDTDSTPGDDTIVAFGGAVKNDGGTAVGLTAPITVATFTFKAVGAAGAHTDLTMTGSCTPSPCASFLTPAGVESTPTPNNGLINIVASTGTTRLWGDADCNGAVAPRDSQAELKHFLSQTELSQTPPCPAIGSTITFDGISHIWGDNDCNGSVAPRDGQAGLKHFLNQTELSQTPPCPVLGTAGQVSP